MIHVEFKKPWIYYAKMKHILLTVNNAYIFYEHFSLGESGINSMIFLDWHLLWEHNSKSIVHRKKIKLAPEREFKTVFIGTEKMTQSGCLQLVCRLRIFLWILPIGSRIICSGTMCSMSLTVFFSSSMVTGSCKCTRIMMQD